MTEVGARVAFLRALPPKLVLALLLTSGSLVIGCAQIVPADTSPEATGGWKIKFDGSGSSPVIADGVLYVGSADGAVYALDPKTGTTKWRFQTGESLSAATSGPQVITVSPGTNISDQMSAGMNAATNRNTSGIRRVDMTPAVANGTVFIGAGDHSFYAIDAATGQKKWAFVAGPGMASKIYSSPQWPAPMVHRGLVYCVAEDGLHALDMTTGERKWHFPGQGLTKRPAPGLAPDDSTIFLTRRDRVYAVAAESGTMRWEITVDGVETTRPVAAKGWVLVGSSPNNLSKSDLPETLSAIGAADGRVRWRLAAGRKHGPSRLFVAGSNTIYFSTDTTLLAVELDTGRQVWSFSADEIQGDVKADDHHVYVVTNKGSMTRPRNTLHALALTTGQEKWSQRLSIAGSIRMLHDGVVYLEREAIDAATGKTLWSFSGGGREEARLISEGQIFLVSPTVTYFGLSRVDQGYLYALDARTGKP